MTARYASTRSFIACAASTLNPSTPSPWRAAFSNVGGFPAATHMGGCVVPPPYGLGRMLRGGTRKYVPSKEYSCWSHIFVNWSVEYRRWSASEPCLGFSAPPDQWENRARHYRNVSAANDFKQTQRVRDFLIPPLISTDHSYAENVDLWGLDQQEEGLHVAAAGA